MKKAAVILAAGKGKRMKSDLPKVLHTIRGRPIVTFLLDTLTEVGFDRILVVIGHKGELVKKALSDYPVEFVWQRQQLGTGDAVKACQGLLAGFEGVTLVAAGDVPFLSASAIDQLISRHGATGAAATCLSAEPVDPKQYGRILRDGNTDRLIAIVEYKDAPEDIRAVREVNTGTFCFDNSELFEALDEISNDNAQGEYYLTDVVKILYTKGLTVSVVKAPNPDEVEGVNSVEELKNLAGVFGDRLGSS